MNDIICPHCGLPNHMAHESGWTEGAPPEYHAACWWEIVDARAREQLEEGDRYRKMMPSD